MRTVSGGAWFALGILIAFLGAAAVFVYVFGQVERMKGPHTTFAILAWVAPVVTLVSTAVHLIGVRVWAFAPSGYVSFVTGVSIALLFWLLATVGRFLPDQAAIALAWIACLGGSFLAPRILRGGNSAAPRRARS